jgi:hypothetical protein
LEQDVKLGMHDVQNLTKDHSLLKQKFVKHCKSHADPDKQNYKTRRKTHQESIAVCGDNNDSDSDETLDSQAPLMDEINTVRARLQLAKSC